MSTRGWIEENKFTVMRDFERVVVDADALREQVEKLVLNWPHDHFICTDGIYKDGCRRCQVEHTFLGEQQPQEARGK